jgi:hypothetical protein
MVFIKFTYGQMLAHNVGRPQLPYPSSAPAPNDENKVLFTMFPKRVFLFYTLKGELLLELLWWMMWSISEQMAHCLQGKVGFVCLEPTLTLTQGVPC